MSTNFSFCSDKKCVKVSNNSIRATKRIKTRQDQGLDLILLNRTGGGGCTSMLAVWLPLWHSCLPKTYGGGPEYYRNFKRVGTKLERCLPKNQHNQRKFLNFENWCSGKLSKIGHHYSDLKLLCYPKMSITRNLLLNSDDFWHR